MEYNRLPLELDELDRLERRLAAEPLPMPSGALRRRVLGGVRAELHRRADPPRWRFAAAAASVLFAWVGLAMGTNRVMNAVFPACEPSPAILRLAQDVRRLAPDYSPEEAVRVAVRYQFGVEWGAKSSLADQLCLNCNVRCSEVKQLPLKNTVDRQVDEPSRERNRSTRIFENPQSSGMFEMMENQSV